MLRRRHRSRPRLALACVVVALAGQLALPLLHAVVHRLEAAIARGQQPAWRVEPTASATHAHAHGHAHGHDDHPPQRERHRHPGDERGRHGAGAPEHLEAVLAVAPPPVVGPGHQPIARADVPEPPVVAAPTRLPSTIRIRGPPVVC